MKQTAMQEFIEWVDTIIIVLPDESLGAKSQMIIAKLKAESMLEKEKEQMKDAFTGTHYYTPFDSHVAFEEYYKEVYGGE